MQKQKPQQLNEGLRSKDLKDFVDEMFTVDQYRSKMGEDRDVVVLGFRVSEKNPAADLMEFLERGYQFILDADMSTGEEHDGRYQVFVEIERTENLPGQVEDLLRGVGQLTDIKEWRFRYQKSPKSIEYTKETIKEHVPLTAKEYEQKVMEIKTTDVKEFFDQLIELLYIDCYLILRLVVVLRLFLHQFVVCLLHPKQLRYVLHAWFQRLLDRQ